MAPSLAVEPAMGAHSLQFPLELRNALLDAAAINLQLGLAGAAQSNSQSTRAGAGSSQRAGSPAARTGCHLAREVGPISGQAGQAVFVLGKLHLQAPLAGVSMLGEDIQDEGCAIQHLDFQSFL